MQSFCRQVLICVAVGQILACAAADRDPLVPTEEEQARLDAQFERVFAGVEASQADREAVRSLHQFAYWVEAYHDIEARYPLSDRLDGEVSFVQTMVYGDDSGIDFEERVNLRRSELLAELQRLFGPELNLPVDPDAGDYHGMHYSTSGPSYIVAVDLGAQVNGGEMTMADMGQYRLASYSSEQIPIHHFRSILDGTTTSMSPVRWRDPSMAR